MWAPGREYELRVPVGLRGESRPLFIVQVLVSNALLRETLIPGIRRIVVSASLAYLVALALVWVVAEVTRRNLRRIEDLIDHIGDDTSPLDDRTRPAPATTEFDAVESKLTLMQGRVRGALHEAQDYRERVGALLKALEEAVILFEGERVVLVAGRSRTCWDGNRMKSTGAKRMTCSRRNASLFRLLRARVGDPANRPITLKANGRWAQDSAVCP